MENRSESSAQPLQIALRNRNVSRSGQMAGDVRWGDAMAEYRALREQAGLADLTGRSRIELSGADRGTFLNNFCTNDIRRLQPGDVCEAFVTSVQGKTLAHVLVLHQHDRLLLETVPLQEAVIQTHLEKYVIREDVAIVAQTKETAELLCVGPDSKVVLQRLGVRETPELSHSGCRIRIEGIGELWIHRVDMLVAGALLVICGRKQAVAFCDALLEQGIVPVGGEALEMLRIEAGWPCFGRDFGEQNLPQEIGRDAQAICFTKGCYLGQETVARLDALGHVNRMLVGVCFDSDAFDRELRPPFELTLDGKCQGEVTSLAWSPKLETLLGMAMVRASHRQPGSRFDSPIGPATVVSLPIGAE